jgi:hypothetical protein
MSELGHPIERLGLRIMRRPNPSEASATQVAANPYLLDASPSLTRTVKRAQPCAPTMPKTSAACARDIDRFALRPCGWLLRRSPVSR